MSVGQTPTWRRHTDRFVHPARVIAGGFATVVLLGSAALSLPFATETGQRADPVDALFTATSAVCIAGLTTVGTGTHWSHFGEVVIMILMQVGGLGIMTMATVFTILASRRLGVRARFLARAEMKSLNLGNTRRIVRNIALFSLISETVIAILLGIRFAVTYEESPGAAIYHAIFHSVSAFNNGGFSTYDDSLTRYVTDPWISLTIAGGVILGGLGFPVVFDLLRNWRRPSRWLILTRITLLFTAILLVTGTVALTLTERLNDETMGGLTGPQKLLAGFFTSAMTRSGGFNSIDTTAMHSESLIVTSMLMFVGGGSAGTGGGIKVTTFGLLAFMLPAEIRGEPQVVVGRRSVPLANQRQALAIALLGVGVVAGATVLLLAWTSHTVDRVLFEVVSAFATCGLSAGITADLPTSGHFMIVFLMFAGRVGPLTLASALALRERTRRFTLPEERTIVG
ncbi:MAG: TrkH family potassium uptake protein [Micromonosporaceae bacterium]|nr:TrkH family potassium uptake protein [Micromonosporaceae bacterium]